MVLVKMIYNPILGPNGDNRVEYQAFWIFRFSADPDIQLDIVFERLKDHVSLSKGL